jgi:hypothetical protein
VAALQKSVFLEKLLEKGYEVLFFTEPMDEYMMTHLTEFDDKKFQDASKDDVKLGKEDKKGLKKFKVRHGVWRHDQCVTCWVAVGMPRVVVSWQQGSCRTLCMDLHWLWS